MAETVTMPKLGFDMAEGTLVRWVIQEGEPVHKGAVLAEIETDKATVEVESNFDGILAQQLVQAGEVVPVNTPIAVIAAPGEKLEQPPLAAACRCQPRLPTAASPAQLHCRSHSHRQAAQAPAASRKSLPGGVKASPLARRMAADAHINLALVPGSGPGGRIVQRDVKAYLTGAVPAPTAVAPSAAAGAPVAAPQTVPQAAKTAPLPLAPIWSSAAPPSPDQVIPLTRLRAAIGRRMVESKQQVPHFYVTHEYDVEALLALRTQDQCPAARRREDLGQRFHRQGRRPGLAPVPQPECFPAGRPGRPVWRSQYRCGGGSRERSADRGLP